MAKKQMFAWTAVTAVAVTLSGCGEELETGSRYKGFIAPQLTLSTNVESAVKKPARVAPADLTANDLSLKISAVEGQFSKTWASLGEFDAAQRFDVGRYNVEAFYGNRSAQGFDCPAYYGSTEVTVRENETTSVSINATLAQSMVSVVYTDAFKNYMKEYEATAHSAGNDYVYFAQTETRPAYMIPGEAELTVGFTDGNGKSAALQVAKFTAEARHHYTITVDLNNGSGGGNAVLNVMFDDSLTQDDVVVELSDELMNNPSPTVEGVAPLTDGSVFGYIPGDEWDTPLKANIMAPAGLKSVTLTTQSPDLLAAGWPAEIDLMAADAAMQKRLQDLGLKAVGLWKNPGMMAVLDFTGVVSHITSAAEASHVFAFTVTDRMNKLCQPFAFAVSTKLIRLGLANAAKLPIGSDELSLELTYNGERPERNLTFQYLNDRGTWTPLAVKSIASAQAADTYNVTLQVAPDNKPLSVRVCTNNRTSEPLSVERYIPAYNITFGGDAAAWATGADFGIECSEMSASALAPFVTAFVSHNGSIYTRQAVTANANGTLHVSGLTPDTRYSARFSLTGSVDNATQPVSFVTEKATQLPNADFEDLTETIKVENLEQGGKWSISAGIYYQNKCSFTVSEPNGWASVNDKTMSSTTANTWFKLPSTFNSSIYWKSTVPKLAVIGTGGGTETPASYSGFNAQAGSNAMVMRNVRWNPAGVKPNQWKQEGVGSDQYYGHNLPAEDGFVTSAGKLFLGGYSYVGGRETYNQGVAFASRPKALKGYYRYLNDANDAAERGLVTVQVLSGATVIGEGRLELSASDAYAPFSVPVAYVAGAPRATQIRVMFASSNYTDESRIQVSTFNYRYESAFHGATLVVDNLQLAY